MKVDIKAGIKTSEFWITMLGIVIVAGAESLKMNLDITAVIGVITTVVTYVASRTVAKKAAAEVKKDV